jgi:hypothetical protein
VQTKGDTPGTISIKVAPAPPPSGDEYPEIKAAVQAAQKEVKAGAKLKFSELYRLGQVVGTGHYARVQLAMSLKDGRKYAVKILPKADGKEALVQQLQSECEAVACQCCLQSMLSCSVAVNSYSVIAAAEPAAAACSGVVLSALVLALRVCVGQCCDAWRVAVQAYCPKHQRLCTKALMQV